MQHHVFQAVIGAGCLFFQLAACLNVAAPTLNLLPGNLPPDKPKICRRKLARLTFKHVVQTALADNKVTAIQPWSSDDELIIPRLNRACCNLKPLVKICEKWPAGHKNTLYLKPVDEDPLMIRAAKESRGNNGMSRCV